MSSQSAIYNPTQTTSAATGDGFSVPRLTTTGRLAITFTALDAGMMVYDTTLNNLFIWTGAAWESIPASGDAGANGSVQYNDNGIVSGASNFFWDKANNRVGINNATPGVALDVTGAATITGDLTVDTSTLKVDSANNRVGIGTASPTAALHVSSTGSVHINQRTGNNGCFTQYMDPTSSNYVGTDSGNFRVANNSGQDLLNIQQLGVFSFGDGAGGTRMTLNATGLGVQVSPSAPLCVKTRNSDSVGLRVLQSTGGTAGIQFTDDPVTADLGSILATSANIILRSNSFLQFQTGGATERMRIDTSGNVGIGVTPSAWGNEYKVVQTGQALGVYGRANLGYYGTKFNLYNDNTNDVAITTNYVGEYRFELLNGSHVWLNKSTAGTAGVNQTLTQAMTLDASGNLLVGTTGLSGSWNTKLTLSNDSGTTKWAVGPYLGGVTNFLISAGASAGVYLNGTAATSWTSASDERLKDIIEPISNAIAKVGSLRAVIGKFKFDENNTRKPFLIAQDIQAVLPEAVDASNPEKLGVAYTDVIPLLVAAIKELTAEVNALKNA